MRNGLVTKAAIVEELKKSNQQIPMELLEKAVNVFFDEVTTALVCGDRVELRGFASLVVRKRKGRVVRNPRTNAKITVGDKGSLYFRASRDLIKALNNDRVR